MTEWCKCGYNFEPSKYQKLMMLVCGYYMFTCPQCQTRLKLVLVHHVVKVEVKSIENRDKIWKRG